MILPKYNSTHANYYVINGKDFSIKTYSIVLPWITHPGNYSDYNINPSSYQIGE
jgi:hypothetical protein